MTDFEYRSLDGISATTIKAGAVSMLAMRDCAMQGGERSRAKDRGTVIHAALLDPLALARMVSVWDGDRRGKEYLQFRCDNLDKVTLTTDELAECQAMLAAAAANPRVAEALHGDHEEVCNWTDPRFGIGKARLDCVREGALTDIKTASDVSPRARQSACQRYGYWLQMGWYAIAAEAEGYGYVAAQTRIVWIQNRRPFDVVVTKIGMAAMEWGQKSAIEIASRYHRCCLAGHWPGQDCGEEIVDDLPQWMQEEWLSGFDEEGTP